MNISNKMVIIDIVIASIEISIMFKDRRTSAGFPLNAQSMGYPVNRPKRLVESLYNYFTDILSYPPVKDRTKKCFQQAGTDSKAANTAPFQNPHQRKELDI